MSSDSELDNSQLEYVFFKRLKGEQTKKKFQNSVIRDYNMLSISSLISGIPVFPQQLLKTDDTTACSSFIIFLCSLFHVLRTLVCIFITYFSSVLLPGASLAMTFSIFNWNSLIASWIFFFKRNAILYAMQTTIITIEQVNSSKFQSDWKMRVFFFLILIGVASIASPVIFICFFQELKFSEDRIIILGYEVEEKYHNILHNAIIISLAVTYISSAFYCGIIVIISSTMYFHLGDVIMNFSRKLEKRFRYKALSYESLSANLAVFQKITHLNEAINTALSASTLFVYGAVIACFFKAVSMFLTYGTNFLELFLLDVFAFIFAVMNFFMLTTVGNRVWKKNQELIESTVECSRLIIASDPDEKWAVCSSLMLEGIKSVNLCATAGDMFVINNDLTLKVASVLITYGVIIF